VRHPAPAAISNEELEQIHADTRRLDVRARIAYWDKRQSNPETAAHCPNDREHGALTMTGSGSLMICGFRKGGAPCTGSMPVSA
jgi:hypothetical protein